MSTPDDYRAMAEECFRWARRAQTEDKRQAYLDVARTWLEAASGQDCGPWAQTPTLWPLDPRSIEVSLFQRATRTSLLMKAAIDGRLPHGMGIARLTDLPPEWSRQHEMLHLPSH